MQGLGIGNVAMKWSRVWQSSPENDFGFQICASSSVFEGARYEKKIWVGLRAWVVVQMMFFLDPYYDRAPNI